MSKNIKKCLMWLLCDFWYLNRVPVPMVLCLRTFLQQYRKCVFPNEHLKFEELMMRISTMSSSGMWISRHRMCNTISDVSRTTNLPNSEVECAEGEIPPRWGTAPQKTRSSKLSILGLAQIQYFNKLRMNFASLINFAESKWKELVDRTCGKSISAPRLRKRANS